VRRIRFVFRVTLARSRIETSTNLQLRKALSPIQELAFAGLLQNCRQSWTDLAFVDQPEPDQEYGSIRNPGADGRAAVSSAPAFLVKD